ncbi:MAG: microcin C ABC transporter permease YejB [Ardenticatenales bacterium]
MAAYIVRRLLLMVPTLLGILIINFVIVQVAPGGPVERTLFQVQHFGAQRGALRGSSGDVGAAAGGAATGSDSRYRGAKGLRPELIAQIEKRYGFDKPPLERFWLMLKNYARFDLGKSFFTGRTVLSMVRQRLPVSMSLGLWSTLIIYLISIPLGIRKAVRDGSRFDVSTSTIIATLYAIPGFLFAILLIILFAGGSFLKIFPLRGLHASGAESLGWGMWIADYVWHLVLPVATLVIGGFAGLTLLTKNSFLDEINKQYVVTARAKGLTERRILYGHVFRNAMLIVISGFPAALLGIFFTEALLIENIFSIEGLGLMSFQAVVNRDYPVFFGTLYLFTLLGLLVNLLSDLTYVWVDPRIDFERRGG